MLPSQPPSLAVVLVLALLGTFAGGTAAQEGGALTAGRRALDAGKLEEAARHLLVALEQEPARVDVADLLVEASAKDRDARLLWAHRAVQLASDASGRAKLPPAAKEALKKDASATDLASARAAAVKELVSFAARRQKRAGRTPSDGLVAAWARTLAWEVARGTPALEASLVDEPPPRVVVEDGVHEPVLDALEKELAAALAGSRAGDALELARALHGFCVQADFEDLQGEAPSGVAKGRTTAATAMRKARAMMDQRAEEPWTVEELEWLGQNEGEAFTREHGSFAEPAVAVSPNGLYRIETDCGYRTLLGVARTIELHHARLAKLFGTDPFEGRQGLVRVVPEAWGLEAEGAPFWWAGGFQGGDTTTVRFSCGTIEGLGRTLTHELTHRFDGALLPGQPSWLVEGKAVWTAAAYGSSAATEFVDEHAIFGTVEGAFVDGYGGEEKLTDLVRGEPEDYRDNYVAGYALYLYLRTWKAGGRLVYADALEAFSRGAAQAKGDPLQRFTEHFADGVDGRPVGFAAFAEAFGEFVAGFYWRDPAPFTERYVRELEGVEDELVLDEPTLVWSRRRAEPYFGSDQARRAGELLQRLGKRDAAMQAYAWALAVDGRDPRTEARLLPLLDELGQDDAAWVVRATLAGPLGERREPPPFWNKLAKTRALLDLLAEVEAAYRSDRLPYLAEVLRADRTRLASATGALGDERPAYAGGPRDGRAHPFEEPGRAIDAWVEDGLTDFEDLRREDLWFHEDGRLVLGRKSARTGTGRFDRRAYNLHTFARSTEWVGAGRYAITGRVRFTTAFATGAFVLGYARRDQNLRVHFRGGDFLYAIGESEDDPKFEDVHWRFDGLRERDGPLRAAASGRHRFHTPTPTFEFELVVDGSSVEAWFDGVHVGTYHTVDGAPIEGHVGFASSYGSFEVQHPTVRRLDRGRHVGAPWSPAAFGSLDGRTGISFEELENRSFRGLPPSPNGTILLWIACPARDEDPKFDPQEVSEGGLRRVRRLHRVLSRMDAQQALVVAAPEVLGEDVLADLRGKLAELDPTARLVTHAGTGLTPEGMEDCPDAGKSWLFFVDPFDVVRLAIGSLGGPFQADLELWLDVFRDVGHPERDLPEVVRKGATDDAGDEG